MLDRLILKLNMETGRNPVIHFLGDWELSKRDMAYW